jgi:hypothetical protein
MPSCWVSIPQSELQTIMLQNKEMRKQAPSTKLSNASPMPLDLLARPVNPDTAEGQFPSNGMESLLLGRQAPGLDIMVSETRGALDVGNAVSVWNVTMSNNTVPCLC